MTELENYKKYWKQARINESVLKTDSLKMNMRVAEGNAASAKKSLHRQFILSLVMGLAMILFVPVMGLIGFPLWLSIVYGVTGLVVVATSIYFTIRLKRTDIFALPTVEALESIIALTKKLKTVRTIRLLLAFVVCGLLLAASVDMNQEILEGLSMGLILGVILGFLRLKRQNALLKTIKVELQNILDSALMSD